MAEPAQVVGGGEPGRPGADDEHALARSAAASTGTVQPCRMRLVAEEPLDGVDADGLVELAAVARGLAGVVADPADDRGERVVGHDLAPRRFVAPLLRVVEPPLDVLPGRAGVVARRQQVDVDRPLGAPGAGLVGQAGADVEGDRERLVHHSLLVRAVRSGGCCGRRCAWIRAITSVRRRGREQVGDSGFWGRR